MQAFFSQNEEKSAEEKFLAIQSLLSYFRVNGEFDPCEDPPPSGGRGGGRREVEAVTFRPEPGRRWGDPLGAPTDMGWFARSAGRYRLGGAGLAELCDHNAAVAESLGRSLVAMTWLNFKTFYGHPDVSTTVKALPLEMQVS